MAPNPFSFARKKVTLPKRSTIMPRVPVVLAIPPSGMNCSLASLPPRRTPSQHGVPAGQEPQRQACDLLEAIPARLVCDDHDPGRVRLRGVLPGHGSLE